MPMNWNAESHAKLFAILMKQCDVRPKTEDLDAIAKVMGCTPKAIKHQLQHFRDAAKAKGSGDGDGAESPTVTPKAKAKTSKTTTTPKKGDKKTAAARTPSPDVESGPTPPPSSRPKRSGAKRDYADGAGSEDGEDDGMSKKVKIEVGEDIGEGLRQTNEFEEAMAAGGEDGEDAFT